MKKLDLVLFALIALIIPNSGCQRSLASRIIASHNRSADSNASSRTSTSSTGTSAGSFRKIDTEYYTYGRHVQEKFLQKDFAWVDEEARKVRLSKERLPGGYWKLVVVYDAVDTPPLGDHASDGDWEDLLNNLASWSKQRPTSVTAKVALASAWAGYAWKARGDGYADSVSDTAWEVFRKRLDYARQALADASALDERCPHWFDTALRIGVGQGWGRADLDKIFDAGVQLEPTFYYLYQWKSYYLLPRWGGNEGEWERFADESALRLGGNQGDIIFFTIYSSMLSLDGMSLMNSHQQVVPKLLAGYQSIEKLYRSSPHRLNEAAFFASFGGDPQTSAELFAKIGDNFDESVWHSKQTYEVFRQGSQLRAKAAPTQPQPAQRSVGQIAPAKN